MHLSEFEFHGFRYTLKTDAHDHSVWNDVTVSKAVRAVPSTLEDQPLFLSIDDTMVEKSGKHFDLCSKLYDHAAHNGFNYLNGYCVVRLLLSIPVYQDGKIFYLSVPVGYRLWDKEKICISYRAQRRKREPPSVLMEQKISFICHWPGMA